ncbi:hypothetical protein SteCoe_15973 [Stentor coeruleus]|uniref:Uncharacterized protein n=1 Tax=Stentor coeruleus TaxID=5963 RepID=A0A1R2C2I5_9CILI|nr:hypothetical protein SteCoe_15973 [Stentor coeruleus]
MGCADSRELDEPKKPEVSGKPHRPGRKERSYSAEISLSQSPDIPCEMLYKDVENSLGLNCFSAENIVKLINSHSSSNIITEENLINVLSLLKINRSEIMNFYANFKIQRDKKSSTYNTQALKTLIIIMARGNLSTKAQLLFANYNSSSEQVLDISSVMLMIEDIIFIALEVIPKHALFNSPDNSKIMSEIIDFQGFKSVMSNHFLILLLENRKFITKEHFFAKFNNHEAKKLASPHGMRKCCLAFKGKTHMKSLTSPERKSSNKIPKAPNGNWGKLFK